MKAILNTTAIFRIEQNIKLLDVSAVTGLGWKAQTGLEEGIAATYKWYLENSV
jgi:nucleoside-diphosphate-sugar epimerase